MTNFKFTSMMDDELNELINNKLNELNEKMDTLAESIDKAEKGVKEKAQEHETNMAAEAKKHEETMAKEAKEFQEQAQEKIDSIDPRIQKLEKSDEDKSKTIKEQGVKIGSMEQEINKNTNSISGNTSKINALEAWRNTVSDFLKAFDKLMGKLTGR